MDVSAAIKTRQLLVLKKCLNCLVTFVAVAGLAAFDVPMDGVICHRLCLYLTSRIDFHFDWSFGGLCTDGANRSLRTASGSWCRRGCGRSRAESRPHTPWRRRPSCSTRPSLSAWTQRRCSLPSTTSPVPTSSTWPRASSSASRGATTNSTPPGSRCAVPFSANQSCGITTDGGWRGHRSPLHPAHAQLLKLVLSHRSLVCSAVRQSISGSWY